MLRAALREIAAVPALALSQLQRLTRGMDRRLVSRLQDLVVRLQNPAPARAMQTERPRTERGKVGAGLLTMTAGDHRRPREELPSLPSLPYRTA